MLVQVLQRKSRDADYMIRILHRSVEECFACLKHFLRKELRVRKVLQVRKCDHGWKPVEFRVGESLEGVNDVKIKCVHELQKAHFPIHESGIGGCLCQSIGQFVPEISDPLRNGIAEVKLMFEGGWKLPVTVFLCG